MEKSFNSLINKIISVAESTVPMLKKVKYVDAIDQIDIEKGKNWPALYILADDTNSITLNQRYAEAQVQFFFCSPSTSRTNSIEKDKEIKSEMAAYADIIFGKLEQEGVLRANQVISLGYMSGRLNNGLSGVTGTVSFPLPRNCYKVLKNATQ